MPTFGTFNTRAHIAAIRSSSTDRGGRNVVTGRKSGSGSAPRSSFPLWVSGMLSTTTRADGSMLLGSLSERKARISVRVGARPALGGSMYATSRC